LQKQVNDSIIKVRKGCMDVFNAYMCEGELPKHISIVSMASPKTALLLLAQ